MAGRYSDRGSHPEGCLFSLALLVVDSVNRSPLTGYRASGRNRTSAHPRLRQGVVDRGVCHSRPAPAYSRSCCSSLQAFAGMKSGGRPGQACKYLRTEVPPAVWAPVFPGCHLTTQTHLGRRMGAGLSRLSAYASVATERRCPSTPRSRGPPARIGKTAYILQCRNLQQSVVLAVKL